jgi:hypothetical protein
MYFNFWYTILFWGLPKTSLAICLAVLRSGNLIVAECFTLSELYALNRVFRQRSNQEPSFWLHNLTSCNIPGGSNSPLFTYQNPFNYLRKCSQTNIQILTVYKFKGSSILSQYNHPNVAQHQI